VIPEVVNITILFLQCRSLILVCKQEIIEQVFSKSVISKTDVLETLDNLVDSINNLVFAGNSTCISADIQVVIEKQKKEVADK